MKSPLDRRALGRSLTRIANAGVAELGAFDADAADVGPGATRIGLTGAPGAGKSTLAGRLALLRAAAEGGDKRRLGVLAIDPTSPRSAGAILGDRIRMDDLEGSEQIFIRSLGSRSASDGLTDNLPDLLALMDRFGFDEVMLETVGVGQAEYAVRTQVDTLVLVLPPDGGDAIQAMKAGVMELADVYVVNKADLPAAGRMAAEVKRILALTHKNDGGWVPSVLLTTAQDPASITALSVEIDCHLHWLQTTGRNNEIALERKKYRLRRWLERKVREAIERQPARFFDHPAAQQIDEVLRTLASPT